jgi:transcription initiation factor TFIIIB Brf1 subunit/transcription initiation factor TFIIB
MLYFYLSGCVPPKVMVLGSNPVDYLFYIKLKSLMVKFKSTFSFGFSLEFQRVKETVRIISKVLRVATETIRTRYRKIT